MTRILCFLGLHSFILDYIKEDEEVEWKCSKCGKHWECIF